MAKKQKDDDADSNKLEHELIPEHELMTDEEKEKLFEELDVTLKELPKIRLKDPAIQHLDATPGDVIRIKRDSPTAGKSTFYRGVVDE